MYGDKIATVTVDAGGASSIDFTSIPQTYTDLVVVTSLRASSSSTYHCYCQVNATTSGYTIRELEGDGTAAYSFNQSSMGLTSGLFNGFVAGSSTSTANTFSNASLYLPNYTGSANKTSSVDAVVENNGTYIAMAIGASASTVTAAITSLSIKNTGGNFAQYSSATLYGITKGTGGATVS